MDISTAVLSCLLLSFNYGISSAAHTLIAPQILRDGVEETIILNLDNVDGNVSVTSTVILDGTRPFVIPNADAQKPIPIKIKYDKPSNAKDDNKRKYVEVIVIVKKGADEVHRKSLKMRMIEKSGYVHVQTDRPIYRPEETVKVRVAALTQEQTPDINREVEIVIRIPLDRIVVDKKTIRMSFNKYIETTFKIPETPIFGIWSIEARFADEKQAVWSTIKFAVQEYVLPSFDVKLEMDRQYIMVRDDMINETISGVITARYSYGKSVSGSYFLVAKLNRGRVQQSQIFYQFPSDMTKSATIVGGEQKFSIKASEIRKLLGSGGSFDQLIDESATVTIEASVTDRAQGIVEFDVSRPIKFVQSPYKIEISRMSKYFVPGTIFEVKLDVLDSVSGKPMENVGVQVKDVAGTVLIEKETDVNGQINGNINTDNSVDDKEFSVQTKDTAASDVNEARITFRLQAYSSSSKSYLQLTSDRKIAKAREKNFEIDVWFNRQPKDMRYVILSRGSIVGSGLHTPQAGSFATSISIDITGDMVPSFRFFVYYFHGAEIVSNSMWIDVENECKEKLTVTVPEMVAPGEHVQVQYSGSPNAILGLSAVDRAAYFLYDESRLTRESAFAKLETYDNACVREGGKNARHVFEEGGLQLVGGPYPAKQDFTDHCQKTGMAGRRKKRDVEHIEAKLEREKENVELNCKLDGFMQKITEENCTKRAGRVQKYKGYECAKIFNEACNNITRLRKLGRSSARTLGSNAGGLKTSGNSARTNFEESMLWTTDYLDDTGKRSKIVIAKDSITTFEFDTISMHSKDGFCVAETQNMKIFKDVFIKLSIPYSLKRMEQVEIRATVFNYATRDHEITVSVRMGEDICSHFPQGEFADVATLHVDGNSAATTSFALLPLRIPDDEHVHIEVAATTDDGKRIDWVKKSILVQTEGTVQDIKGTRAIDLKKKRIEEFEIELMFPEKYIPNTKKCWIYYYSNFMGPIIQFDPVTKQPTNDIKNIIRLPQGCGEQTVAIMGPNVFAHMYLTSVGKITPGSTEEKGYVDKMKSGFLNELDYRTKKVDPMVWATYHYYDPSVWLNAYVNKIFSKAKEYYKDMTVTTICNSIEWLISMQDDEGWFKTGRGVSARMHGAVGSRLSLSAYVLMSLVQSSHLCPLIKTKVETSVGKTITYLQANEQDSLMKQPYTFALVTYAMSVADKTSAFSMRLRKGLIDSVSYSLDNRLAFWKAADAAQIYGTGTHAYWYNRRPLAVDIEATGYALMAILAGMEEDVSQKMFDLTRKITLYLIEQRDENGGFSTTQDTVVGLQAIAEYMIWSNTVQPPSTKVSIALTFSGEEGSEWFGKPKLLHLNETNEDSPISLPVPKDVVNKGKLKIKAEGEGDGSISYRCTYNILINEESCHYDLTVETSVVPMIFRPVPGEERPLILKIAITVAKRKGAPSGQSIVEVNLISGFIPVRNTLEAMSRAEYVDGTIDRFEIANQKVILYLDEIVEEPTVLAFHLSRAVEVNLPEPSTVTVYDYYEPKVKCTQFYGLGDDIPKLRTTPCKKGDKGEDMCKCAEGGCLTCRSRSMQLDKTECLSSVEGKCVLCDDPTDCHDMVKHACDSDYVYEIEIITGVQDKSGVFVAFEAMITHIYKRGNDVGAKINASRTFMTRNDCFSKCKDPELDKDGERDFISEGRKMMVMGKTLDVNNDRTGNPVIQYRLEEGSFVERIIPQDKCEKTKKKYTRKCTDKKKLSKTEKAECKILEKMNIACRNMIKLKKKMIVGCDNTK